MKRNYSIVAVLSLMMSLPLVSAAQPLVQQVEETLEKAARAFYSINTKGGYVGIYSPDLSQRFGESFYERAAEDEIWVQPPGTPTIGEAFLRAYVATGRQEFLDYAIEAALALCWGQRAEGGWTHRVNVAHRTSDPRNLTRNSGRNTFDDNISQGAITFLMTLDTYIDRPWLTESIRLALDFFLESQFQNGAWPQWYPLRGGYHDYYTFNDNAINDNIRVMMRAYELYGNQAYLESALAGGQFIIDSQWKSPQSGWAQQYSHDMQPAWARRFEPPGISSSPTVRNIHTLMNLYLFSGDQKFLKPIPAAIQWLNDSKLSNHDVPVAAARAGYTWNGDIWARIYEVDTNIPVYGDREDGDKFHYDYYSVSERERTSYGWRGSYGVAQVIARFVHLMQHGNLDGYGVSEPDESALRARAQQAINALNEDGFWLIQQTPRGEEPRTVINSRPFVVNMNALCDYLEFTRR